MTGADGSVTYSGLTTGTYTISYNDSSVDYAPTGATSQTVNLTNTNGNVTLNFRVTPLYTISGNIYNDNNHNANYDAGDTLYTGSTTIHISGGPTAVADMTQTNGTYTTPETLWSGNYTVTRTSTLPGGYTTTTPVSNTVTVGNVAAPGPHCWGGSSNDAVCGNPNNGSLTGINFGIDAPYQISGRVFNDKNKNLKYDSATDTVFTGAPSIRIVGPTSMTVTANATTGLYTTGQVLSPGTYTVSYNSPLPSQYSFQTPSSWQVVVGYNPACNTGASPDATCEAPNTSSINNLNFGLTNENSWDQSVCLDVRSDTLSYSNPIPAAPSCGGVSGAYNSVVNGSCATGAGIIYTCQATPDFGLGSANALNWQAGGAGANAECYNGPGLDVIRTSYNYLLTTARQSNITPIDMNQVSVCGVGGIANCTLSDSLPKGVYQANGNLTLNGYTFPHPADPTTTSWGYIFLVNGNLRLNGNVLIPKGSAAAFSASGNINVSSSVGQVVTNSTDPSVNNPNLEGIYSADASFIIESATGAATCNADGTPIDKKLNVIGSIITNAAKSGGSFVNNRDLCIFDLSCSSLSVGDGSGASSNGNGGTGGTDGSGATGPGTIVSYWLTLLQDGQFLNHKLFNWSELRP